MEMRIYKDALGALCEQLTYLYNLSLITGCFPLAWKRGLVTPLPMKGDTSDVNDIRPITITHICGNFLKN